MSDASEPVEPSYDWTRPFADQPWEGNDEFRPVPGEPPRSGFFGVVRKYQRRVDLGSIPGRRYAALKFIGGEVQALDAVQEATALRAGHGAPTVVQLVKVFRVPHPQLRDREVAVIATEWVDGIQLENFIAGDEPPLTPLNLLDIVADVAEALDVFHNPPLGEEGVPLEYRDFARAHGDVKLENVIVTLREDRARAKVCDLGVSAAIGVDGFPAGVPMYRAPEVYEGRPARPESDLYQLGVFAAELVLRRRVRHMLADAGISWNNGTRELSLTVSRMLREAVDRQPGVPSAVTGLIDRLLDPDPAERATSADVLRARAALAADVATAGHDAADDRLVERLTEIVSARPRGMTLRAFAPVIAGTAAFAAGGWFLTDALLGAV